jgi:hypothetical protein
MGCSLPPADPRRSVQLDATARGGALLARGSGAAYAESIARPVDDPSRRGGFTDDRSSAELHGAVVGMSAAFSAPTTLFLLAGLRKTW